MTDRVFTRPDDAPEGHEWQTLEGSPVRIYATDGEKPTPIHGAVQTQEGEWEPDQWRADGTVPQSVHADHYGDLEDKPRKVTVWLNIFSDGKGQAHGTRLEADMNKGLLQGSLVNTDVLVKLEKRIACIKVEFEEGEGL